MKTYVYTKTYRKNVQGSFILLGKTKQSIHSPFPCPSIGKWTDKLCHSHSIGWYKYETMKVTTDSCKNMNKSQKNAGWVKKVLCLMQTSSSCIIPFTWSSRTDKSNLWWTKSKYQFPLEVEVQWGWWGKNWLEKFMETSGVMEIFHILIRV